MIARTWCALSAASAKALCADGFHGDRRRDSSAAGVAAFDHDLQALLAENSLQKPRAALQRVFAAAGRGAGMKTSGLARTLSYF